MEESKNKAADLLNDLKDIDFVEIIAIVVGTWLLITLLRWLLPYLAERAPSKARLYLLGAVPIARLLLMTVAIIWIIPMVFNVTFQNFIVIAGAASVAIGFAFKDYVSSIVAGIVAVFERPYRPGDWVEIDGDYGEVQSVGLRSIRILTPSDDVVTVPHGTLWDQNISNSNDGARTLMCVTHFYLAPDHDAHRMRALLHDVALTSPYLDYAEAVLVMIEETPYGTHYRLKAYPFEMRDQFSFISDLTERGRDAIAATGARVMPVPYAPPDAAGA